MKKLILCLLAFMLVAALLAEEALPTNPFLVRHPSLMAQGGSTAATAHGVHSLYTNPAGLAKTGFNFTLASVTANIHMLPDMELIEEILDGADPLTLLSDPRMSQQLKTGIGASFELSQLAFVINGLGFGLFENAGIKLQAPDGILSLNATAFLDLSVVVGFGTSFSVLGTNLNIGANLRYINRVQSKIGTATLLALLADDEETKEGEDPLDAILDNPAALRGSALALDIGTIVDLGALSFGLAIRDIGGTKMDMYETSIDDFRADPFADSEGEVTKYAIPMTVSAGVAFRPWKGNILLDPTIHAELKNPHKVFADEVSPWTLLHMGTEVRILNGFIKARAGINQGYYTAGLGLKLLLLEVNVAAYTYEAGRRAGSRPQPTIAGEIAIRF